MSDNNKINYLDCLSKNLNEKKEENIKDKTI